MIVAIDVFTKWPEAGPLLTKSSHHTTEWIHREVVCRYGVPALIRCDLGREFMGEFDGYCRDMGITISRVCRANPRANGQCERYNAVIEAGIRKMTSASTGGVWVEFLPSVLAGMRYLPTYLGYPPFTLVFKEGPVWLPGPEVSAPATLNTGQE